MHRHATGTKRARACLFLVPVIMILVMVTRPIYAPLIDVFGPEEQVAGSKRAVVVERDAGAGGADDDQAQAMRSGREARGGEAGAPRRSPGGRTPNITRRGIVREMVRERWVGERRRERFGDGSAKRDGERIARGIARRGEPRSDPRV